MEQINIDRMVVMHDKQFAGGAFGDITVNRPMIQIDGKVIELIYNADCKFHMTSREHNLHLCFGMADMAYKIDDEHMMSCGHIKICQHVCEPKKELFRQLLKEYGQWIPEDKRKFIDEYLAKENTA